MAHKILLNNEEFHFNENNLPCLIHYKEKMGGSQFTVTLVADLFLQGSKILFLTAYQYAGDNFLEQVKGMESKIFFVDKKENLAETAKYQAIILKSGDEELYLEALKAIPDLSERVILIKNFEIFNQNILDSSLPYKKIILSGDIDKSSSKKQISNNLYKTTILFSNPKTILSFKAPKLDKYIGYLNTDGKEGLLRLEME